MPANTDPLVAALTTRFIADPKQAHEVVAGSCEWPSPDGYDSDDLAGRAANMAGDLEDLREQGYPVSQIKIDQLRAAENAFCAMAKDEAQEYKLAQWAAEDMPAHRMPRYA